MAAPPGPALPPLAPLALLALVLGALLSRHAASANMMSMLKEASKMKKCTQKLCPYDMKNLKAGFKSCNEPQNVKNFMECVWPPISKLVDDNKDMLKNFEGQGIAVQEILNKYEKCKSDPAVVARPDCPLGAVFSDCMDLWHYLEDPIKTHWKKIKSFFKKCTYSA